MFLKLVKHELHELLRVLLPIFGGLLLFAGVTRGLIWLMQQNDNPILSVTGGMFIGLFFMSCVACVILTAVLLLVRFAKSVHGDEGYLTHTLPVGVHSILCSRLLVSVLFLAAAMGTAIGSVLISTWRLEELSEISEGIGLIFESAGLKSGFWWTILASVFVQTVTTVLMVFAAISIGHSFNRGKVGFSILFYFALNTTASMISTILSLLLMNTTLFDEAAEFSTVTSSSMALSIGMNLVFCGVYYFIAWIMTRKRLNLS